MEYRQIGKSGLKVSEIGLGAYPFGGIADEQTSIKIIDHALELGVNFIDTAYGYAVGRSEEIVGKGVKGKRSEVIIATKFGYPGRVGPREQGGSRNYILNKVDISLRRLNTDYIDLYYLHFPDTQTPIEETLRTMDNLIHSGKVRYLGCSNFAAWQLCEALWTSKVLNLESFIAVESRYNLLQRTIEQELTPCCQTYGIGIIPWGPLAGGFLTGKYNGEKAKVASEELAKRNPTYRDVAANANFEKLARLQTFARQRNHSVGELAIAWLLSHPWVGSVIAGVTSIEQVSFNVNASTWRLTAEDIAKVEQIV